MEISFPQILFQIINFSVVLGALTFLLYKPVLKVLEERRKRIAEGLSLSEQNQQEKEKWQAYKADAEKQLKKQVQAELAAAKKQAEMQQGEMIEAAKAKARKEIEKIKQEWLAEQANLQQELSQAVITQTIAAVEQLIQEKLDQKSLAKLTNERLKAALNAI